VAQVVRGDKFGMPAEPPHDLGNSRIAPDIGAVVGDLGGNLNAFQDPRRHSQSTGGLRRVHEFWVVFHFRDLGEID